MQKQQQGICKHQISPRKRRLYFLIQVGFHLKHGFIEACHSFLCLLLLSLGIYLLNKRTHLRCKEIIDTHNKDSLFKNLTGELSQIEIVTSYSIVLMIQCTACGCYSREYGPIHIFNVSFMYLRIRGRYFSRKIESFFLGVDEM